MNEMVADKQIIFHTEGSVDYRMIPSVQPLVTYLPTLLLHVINCMNVTSRQREYLMKYNFIHSLCLEVTAFQAFIQLAKGVLVWWQIISIQKLCV